VTKVSSVSTDLHALLGLEVADSLFGLYVYLALCFPDLTKQPSIHNKQHNITTETQQHIVEMFASATQLHTFVHIH